ELHAMPGLDPLAQCRGHESVRNRADMQLQEVIVGGSLQREGRAVASRRKSPELYLAILAREVIERLRQLEAYAHHVRRKASELPKVRRHREGQGHALGC